MTETGPFYLRRPAFLSLVDLIQLGEQLRIFRNALIVLFGKTNDSILVDNKNSALGKSLLPQAVVHRAYGAVRIKIGEHGKVDAAHFFRKRLVRKRRINTDAQHLSISSLEFLSVFFEVRQFLLSATGKIQRVESEDNVLLPCKILERDILFSSHRQRKFRGLGAHSRHWHELPPEKDLEYWSDEEHWQRTLIITPLVDYLIYFGR